MSGTSRDTHTESRAGSPLFLCAHRGKARGRAAEGPREAEAEGPREAEEQRQRTPRTGFPGGAGAEPRRLDRLSRPRALGRSAGYNSCRRRRSAQGRRSRQGCGRDQSASRRDTGGPSGCLRDGPGGRPARAADAAPGCSAAGSWRPPRGLSVSGSRTRSHGGYRNANKRASSTRRPSDDWPRRSAGGARLRPAGPPRRKGGTGRPLKTRGSA